VRHQPRARAADRGAPEEAARRLPARADPRHQGHRVRSLTMPMHGGRIVAQALRREGVPYVFTLCGGHIMSIYDGCLDDGIGVIDVRHEQSAAHAAHGWARVTGPPRVERGASGHGTTD